MKRQTEEMLADSKDDSKNTDGETTDEEMIDFCK